MFNLNKNTDMNEIITLEEANEILAMAKRLYPGLLDGVYVAYDYDGYAYCRNFITGERMITIYEEPNDELISVSERIMTHVNKEFNANFAMNLKTITIHAFCHEIGHAIDFEMQKFLGNWTYELETNEEYAMFYHRADEYYDEIDDLECYMEEYGIEADEEFVAQWKKNIEDMKDNLDYSYRMITTEYAADKFSTEFMMTHLRYVSQLFNNSEGMMTVEKENIKTYDWKYSSKLCYNVRH